MIHFMIDFENVYSQGLTGAEYLTMEDHVTIFYSKSCNKIEQRKWTQMLDARSRLEICGLKNSGKNALDFYIASRIGELYGSGYEGIVAIVSNDKGFQALKDYWRCCVKKPKNIVLRSSIEQSIVASNENSERRREIMNRIRMIELETEYAKYEERQKLRAVLEEKFKNTAYEGKIKQIEEVFEGGKAKKLIYLDSLKNFGREDGLYIYNKMKEAVGEQ